MVLLPQVVDILIRIQNDPYKTVSSCYLSSTLIVMGSGINQDIWVSTYENNVFLNTITHISMYMSCASIYTPYRYVDKAKG